MTVADRLEADIPEVLRRWEAAVRAAIRPARAETKAVLLDHMPQFLRQMVAALRGVGGAQNEPRETPREHARLRAEQTDYSIEQVILEYGLLQENVLDVLEADERVPPADLRIILQTIQLGVIEASRQFVRLQRSFLAESEERNRSLVQAVIDGIVTIDEHDRIVAFNPGAERMFGYRSAEVIGQPVSRLVWRDLSADTEVDWRAIFRARAGDHNGGSEREVMAVRKDGSPFPASLTVSEYRTSAGLFVTGVFRDITDRKNLELELVKRADELHAQNASKDEFLAVLGHELRNPLAAIRSAAEILKHVGSQEPLIAKSRGIVVRQVSYLVRLVDDLLDIARLNRGRLRLRMAHGDLRPMVQQALEATRSYFEGREQTLHTQLADEPLPVLADAARMTQCVANLLHNAAKFTRATDQVRLIARRSGDLAEVIVEDSGAGIEPPLLARVFALYGAHRDRTETSQGGLGIGLRLVKDLVEMQGGRVSAASEGAGKGSRFTIELPIRENVPSWTEPSPSKTEAADAERLLRIQVVDDNPDAAMALADVLRLQGHQVEVAGTGTDALAAVTRWRPDVVLLDIGLPDLDGYAVARQIRATPSVSDAMLIALTGFGHQQDVVKAREAGFDEHCTKPVDFIVLRRLMQRATG